jgi:hypothetical protein
MITKEMHQRAFEKLAELFGGPAALEIELLRHMPEVHEACRATWELLGFSMYVYYDGYIYISFEEEIDLYYKHHGDSTFTAILF